MRLEQKYQKQIVPEMMKRFGYSSVMAVPKIDKVVINSSFGSMATGKSSGDRNKIAEHICNHLALMTGQKPVIRPAKKSISVFKLREGMPIGAKVSLRGKRAYQFLERLIDVVLPRSRDFRGIPLRSMSRQGDLTIGFKEYTPFPEVKIEKEKSMFGLEVVVSTTAKTEEEGEALLRLLGMPLQTTKEIK